MRQKDVASQLGVGPLTVTNWETGATEPEFRFLPAIIQFLGFNPSPSLPDAPSNVRLKERRLLMGLSQKEAAKLMRVDPGSIGNWEAGKAKPTEKPLKKILRFLTCCLPAW